jgi:hypothetical protein
MNVDWSIAILFNGLGQPTPGACSNRLATVRRRWLLAPQEIGSILSAPFCFRVAVEADIDIERHSHGVWAYTPNGNESGRWAAQKLKWSKALCLAW